MTADRSASTIATPFFDLEAAVHPGVNLLFPRANMARTTKINQGDDPNA